MKQVKILSAVGLMALAGTANAGFSSTITATNDYDFRGTSQTATDPALQASLDYAFDVGPYIGAWASNVDFGDDTSYELDLYAGYAHTFASGFGIDAGLVGYTYDESQFNFIEEYVGVSYKWAKFKIFATSDFGGSDEDAIYLTADVTAPLPANFSILAHAGLSTGDFFDNVVGDDVVDYSIGVGYTAGRFNLALKWVGSDAPENKADVFNNEDRVILTVATTFPWK